MNNSHLKRQHISISSFVWIFPRGMDELSIGRTGHRPWGPRGQGAPGLETLYEATVSIFLLFESRRAQLKDTRRPQRGCDVCSHLVSCSLWVLYWKGRWPFTFYPFYKMNCFLFICKINILKMVIGFCPLEKWTSELFHFSSFWCYLLLHVQLS